MENLTRRMGKLRIVGPPKRKRNNTKGTSRKRVKSITGSPIRRGFTSAAASSALVMFNPTNTSRRLGAPRRFTRPGELAIMKHVRSMKNKKQAERNMLESLSKRIGFSNAGNMISYAKFRNVLQERYNPNRLSTSEFTPNVFSQLYGLSNRNRKKMYSNKLKSIYTPFMYNNYNNNNPPRSYARMYNHLKKAEALQKAYINWKNSQSKRNKIGILLNKLNNIRPVKSIILYDLNKNIKNLYNQKIPSNSRVREIIPKNKLTLIHTEHINKPTIGRFLKFVTHKS